MQLAKYLRFAIAGWIGGVASTLLFAYLWTKFFPAIVNVEHYDVNYPALTSTLAITLLIITPVAIIGGIIGSRLPREGGRTEQTIAAVLIGAILVIPFGCISLWAVTGS